VNEKRAARVSGLPIRRLRKHRMLGLDPPFLKIGRSVYYELNSLLAYVRSLPQGGCGVPAAALKRAGRKSGTSLRESRA
jgi:hypothetical protein